MAVDPVCGREVHPKQSQWLFSHNGKAYHFCSAQCERRFRDQPAEFAEITVGLVDHDAYETIIPVAAEPYKERDLSLV